MLEGFARKRPTASEPPEIRSARTPANQDWASISTTSCSLKKPRRFSSLRFVVARAQQWRPPEYGEEPLQGSHAEAGAREYVDQGREVAEEHQKRLDQLPKVVNRESTQHNIAAIFSGVMEAKHGQC
ncbi:unnamed protein product [Lampetra fluviatilis]